MGRVIIGMVSRSTGARVKVDLLGDDVRTCAVRSWLVAVDPQDGMR